MQNVFSVPYDSKEERNQFIENMFCPICKRKSKKQIKSYSILVEDNIKYDYYTIHCDDCQHDFRLKFFDTHEIEYLNDKLEKLKYYIN